MISDRSLALFHKAASELPAYKAYLRASKFDPATVKTVDDFKRIPLTSKKSYLQLALHKDLIWSDSWRHSLLFCATSGSTGEPYYFPRDDSLAEQASIMAEEFLRNSSYGTGHTLVLMGLGMGVWIGGLITLRAFEIAAQRLQAPVSFLPTGYNKVEIFKALKKLSPQFDQTILVGYPPFVKEIVDEAESEGILLKDQNVRLMFAAEAFTERFRTYVCEKVGIKNPLLDTLNIYGTADIGAVAYETPLSILVRKLALENPLLYKDLFGQIEKTPTLAQYNQDFIDFEEVNGEVILTSNSVMPLIRYAIGDHGGVISYDHVCQLLNRYGIDLEQKIKNSGIAKTIKKRPFVFVYERIDMATTLHGIIIYPEFIKEGLLNPKLMPFFTERFTMSTKNDIHHNQFLQINVELKKDIEQSEKLQRQALHAIRNSLIEKSSEFAEVSKSRNSEKLLQVILWPNGHPRYFTPGVKQKWIEKV
jgi:phenylacetate-CoA ligase